MCMRKLGRRSILAGSLATTLAATARPVQGTSGRREILLTGGTVVTMDAQIGTLVSGDVHVRDGAIVAVGPQLHAPHAYRVDVRGKIVMPGFVDTHWHMWNTLLRGFNQSSRGNFAPTMKAFAEVWTPQASTLGVRLALAEAVNAGITTVHNWAHNIKSPEFAIAEIEEHFRSGVRGRFSYGYPQTLSGNVLMDIPGLKQTVDHFFSHGADRLVVPGVCTRGPDRSIEKVWRTEWEAARAFGLPMTTHIACDRRSAATGAIETLHRTGFLGADIQLVHATHATTHDFAMIAESRSSLSVSPWTEMEVGYGLPPLTDILKSGALTGLSVDNMVLAGKADMFGIMQVSADIAAAESEQQGLLSDHRVLEMATIEGARSLGLGDVTGSLLWLPSVMQEFSDPY